MVTTKLISPKALHDAWPLSQRLQDQVESHRLEIKNAIKNNKKVIVVGPCSIHDPDAAIEYGKRLVELQKQVPDIILVMRVYFEKPRTTVGWKGFINDPNLDGTFDIVSGLNRGRKLCIDLLELGLPLATEVLDPFTIKYLSGIFSWVAIGARTTESQTHREIASGLPMAVGFKNSTNGSIQVALDAMASSAYPHRYLGIDLDGQISLISADGNKDTHVILRGGKDGSEYITNFDLESALSVPGNVMVDCSHSNCEGNYLNQVEVAIEAFDHPNVFGLMIESNIVEGNQKLSDNLVYGKSITDACLGWESTEHLILSLRK